MTGTHTTEGTSDPGCLICSMEGSDPDARVFLDDRWAAEVAPGYEVPGWFFLRSRRHAEKLTGLDEAETAELGPRAHDLVSAIEQATGAPAVYVLHFGENYKHFHSLVAARHADLPGEFRGWGHVRLAQDHRNVEQAYALAARVRSAYQDIVTSRFARQGV